MAHHKKLTLLHSNDLHGDFMAEEVDKELVGGISMLSGYVSKVRSEEKNVLYCIAGDMLQGSIIDTEFHGISTIEIMNMLAPDVVTVGNHEVDYGLAHLLFLERCAKFPIVNANLYIKNPFTRLFTPQKIFKVDGMNIMFIGITTEDIISGIQEDILGSFVNIQEAAQEVGRICNAYQHVDIDFTVLLTHIGFEEDKKLAALLDPEWGVDVIIGGHSHTLMDQPTIVNGILIAQAGKGTEQIGRFDLLINTDTNTYDEFKWECVPIEENTCPRDEAMERTIEQFKQETDQKYDRVLCRFKHQLTHPSRYEETELGNLIADILAGDTGVELVMLGSGSVRKTSISTLLQMREFMELFPYDDKLRQLVVTGTQLRRMLAFIFRDEMFDCDHTEFYQYSKGMHIVFDRAKKQFVTLELNGEAIQDDRLYKVGLQEFHFVNFEKFFNVPIEEVLANADARVVSSSIQDLIIEHLSTNSLMDAQVEGRIEILNR